MLRIPLHESPLEVPILWPILPPIDRYTRAAIVHDFLYWEQNTTRIDADPNLGFQCRSCLFLTGRFFLSTMRLDFSTVQHGKRTVN